MLRDSLTEIRAEAKRHGIPWSWVCQLKNDLVRQEREAREHWEGIRRLAWWRHVGPDSGSAPFWRHGFRARFGHRIARGADFTCIPRYDQIASAVALEYPAFTGDHAGDVSATEALWEFLLSDYEPWPPREDFYWRALEQIVAAHGREATCHSTPF